MIRVVANSVGITLPPPPMPLKATVDGLEISVGMFGSLFQAIFLLKYVDKCFNKFCPSLQKMEKWKSTIQKRTCCKCGKYHSTIMTMNSHKRTCDRYEDFFYYSLFYVDIQCSSENLQQNYKQHVYTLIKSGSEDPPKKDEDEDDENEEDYIEVERLLETTKLTKLFTCKRICILCYILYVRRKLS